MANWCTIESDPGVFTELIQEFGVKGLQVEELYSMDDESFAQISPVHGLIFLFKWQREEDNRPTLLDPNSHGIFFANQVINNACATQAILSILLNAESSVQLGDTLTNFKAFTKEFSAEMKGEAINNSPDIQKAHNSFARPEHFVEYDKSGSAGDEDTFHFIAYLPINGTLYELDGLKEGPVSLGKCESDASWLSQIRPHINERINRYSAKEIRFNLMAIINDRRDVYRGKADFHEQRASVASRALAAIAGGDAAMTDVDAAGDQFKDVREAAESKDSATLEEMKNLDELKAADFSKKLAAAQEKFDRWKVDNIRRKHNYIPFIVKILKILAKKKQLQKLIKRAEEKRLQKVADLKASKKK